MRYLLISLCVLFVFGCFSDIKEVEFEGSLWDPDNTENPAHPEFAKDIIEVLEVQTDEFEIDEFDEMEGVDFFYCKSVKLKFVEQIHETMRAQNLRYRIYFFIPDVFINYYNYSDCFGYFEDETFEPIVRSACGGVSIGFCDYYDLEIGQEFWFKRVTTQKDVTLQVIIWTENDSVVKQEIQI